MPLFDYHLIKFRQSGLLDRTVKLWFNENKKAATSANSGNNVAQQLGYKNVILPFIIVGKKRTMAIHILHKGDNSPLLRNFIGIGGAIGMVLLTSELARICLSNKGQMKKKGKRVTFFKHRVAN